MVNIGTDARMVFDTDGDHVSKKLADHATLMADLATNVKSFGAKGDGTLATTAFTNALNSVMSTPKTLYIPNGTYDLTGLTFTATQNLRIIGESKDGVILKNIGKITINKNLHIENLTILDTTTNNIFNITPSSFSNITIRNVAADNTNSNFTNNSRADAFLFCSNSTQTIGINWIEISNCVFSHFASYIARLDCYVKGGVIKENRITEIGYDTNPNVRVFFGGYQDVDNNVTAPFANVVIKDNYIENIYSAYGATHDTTECHGMLLYGDNLKVINNTVKNLYGGGRLQANLESGYDHEAIYLKATNSIIDGNRVSNGAGNYSDGAITVKGTADNTKIINNIIDGLYGNGIYSNSWEIPIYNNTVTLSGSVSPQALACVFVGGGLGNTDYFFIENNKLFNNRPKDGHNSGCVILSNIQNAIIANNFMYSTNDQVIYAPTGQFVGSQVKIFGNEIVTLNGNFMFFFESPNGGNAEISKNKFIYKTDGTSSGVHLIGITDNNGRYKIKDNEFFIQGVVTEIFQLQCLQYILKGNEIHVDPSIAGSILRFTSVVNNAVSTEMNIVSNNDILSSNKVTDFLVIYFGANNIGSLLMENNKANLTGGRFIKTNDSAVLTTMT
jgi:hypothetical protein